MKVKEIIHEWLSNVQMSVMPNTYSDYLNYSNSIIRYIGDIDLKALNRQDVQRMYLDMFNNISTDYPRHAHSILRIVMGYAIDTDLILKNPLKGVTIPKKTIYNPVFISREELHRLLKCSEDYGIYNAVFLAGCAGLRRGECLGLNKSDIDIKRSIIHISRSAEWKKGKRILSTPKSKAGRRSILVSPAFIDSLFRHSTSDFFCDYSQGVLQKKFKRCLKDNGFIDMRIHDLRHTYASLVLESGDNLKSIQVRLGHSNISITLDTYAHLDISGQYKSANLFDDITL